MPIFAHHRATGLLAACAGVLACVAGAPAQTTQDEPRRPRAAERIVHLFDFEERETNPGDVPRYWFRNQDQPDATDLREGYPSWNRAGLVYTSEGGVAFAGEGSVRLPTQGGSTSLLLSPGVLPVFEDADYRVTGMVRTQGLVRARASLRVRLLDAQGKPIEGTERLAQPVRSESAWSAVTVDVPSTRGTAFMELELVLLQPRQAQLEASRLRLREEVAPDGSTREDLSGAALFDNVAVLQMPRVRLNVAGATGVARSDAPPVLSALVRDLTTQALRVRMSVVDSRGVQIASEVRDLTQGAGAVEWTPPLPAEGWYRGRLELITQTGDRVGGAVRDFIWTSPLPTSAGMSSALASGGATDHRGDERRFGLDVPDLPRGATTLVSAVQEVTQASAVTLPAWREDLSTQNLKDHSLAMQALARRLIASSCDVTFALSPLPRELLLNQPADAGSAWDVLTSNPGAWTPYAEDLLERLGTRARAWRVGGRGVSAYWSDDVSGAVRRVSDALSQRVPGATLVLPADISDSWDPALAAGLSDSTRLAVEVPSHLHPLAVRHAGERWRRVLEGAPLGLSVEFVLSADTDAPGAPIDRAGRIAIQLAEVWRLLGPSHDANVPLTVSLRDGVRWESPARPGRESAEDMMRAAPTPELAAWLTARSILDGQRVVGDFPANEGVECVILAGPEGLSRGGTLIAWSEHADPQRAFIDVPVTGQRLRAVDVFGNATPLASSASRSIEDARVVRVPLSSRPVYVQGVDVGLMQFVSAVSIGPELLDAGIGVGEHAILVRNPWGATLSGNVSVLEPGGYSTGQVDRGWRITPRSQSFTVAPGDTARLPISVSFRSSEPAGDREFVLKMEVSGEDGGGVVEIRRTLQLGLRDVRVDATASRTAAGLLVETVLTNMSQRQLTLELRAAGVDQPQQRTTLAGLPPGSQSSRRFLFPLSVAEGGQPVVVSVRDAETGARLTVHARPPAP